MSDVGEWVSIREPRADTFETVISYQDAIDARFLGSFILAMETFANSQDCSLVLDGVAEGSIKLRWKIAMGAVFSTTTLSVAANAAQVAEFMQSAWQNVTEQTSEGNRSGLGKVVCRAIEDETIESITFTQPGGQTVRIDAKSLQVQKPTPGPRIQGPQFGYISPEFAAYRARAGIGLDTVATEIVSDNGPDMQLEQAYEGRIHIVAGKSYFQAHGVGPMVPIMDQRVSDEPFSNGALYYARGRYRIPGGVPLGFVLTDATLID